MVEFFPPGFWKAVAWAGMGVFFVLGADILLGSRLVIFMSRFMNLKFHFDQIVVKALSDLKKNSDKEFDVEAPMLKGWGRFIVSGVLFFGAAIMLVKLIPRL